MCFIDLAPVPPFTATDIFPTVDLKLPNFPKCGLEIPIGLCKDWPKIPKRKGCPRILFWTVCFKNLLDFPKFNANIKWLSNLKLPSCPPWLPFFLCNDWPVDFPLPSGCPPLMSWPGCFEPTPTGPATAPPGSTNPPIIYPTRAIHPNTPSTETCMADCGEHKKKCEDTDSCPDECGL
jgi:hypothetical protein